MTSEERVQVIVGAIGAVALSILTLYICRDGFTKWALLTGFLALGCLGGIAQVFETKSSAGGTAVGLAALFNNMDSRGAETFAQLLNQMGSTSGSSTSEATPATALPTPSGGGEGASPLAAMAPALVAGAARSAALAPGQFRVVVVDSMFSASMSVEMQATVGVSSDGVQHLAVLCFEEQGRDVLQGEDRNKKWWKLEDVRQPAVLYVPRETLPYLEHQPNLWRRVQQEEQG